MRHSLFNHDPRAYAVLRYAAPVFAIGFFVGIFACHVFSTRSQNNYRCVRAEITAVKPVASLEGLTPEFDLLAFEAERLGPELTLEPWWEQFETNRTLYVAPYTGLANTLQSMGSAFTIGYRHKINIRFVFNPPWFGPATWDDLFAFPVVNFTRTFPDGERNIGQTTSCTHGEPPFNWKTADVRWNPNPDGDGEIGCVSTCCWREPPYPQAILWFYKILRPALPLQQKIAQFKSDHDWDHYQWVGVHYRRTDNIKTMQGLLKFFTNPTLREAIDASSAESMLPTEHYVQAMEDLRQLWPVHELGPYQVVKPIRFFLATDHDDEKPLFVEHLGKENVVWFEKGGIDPSQMRNDVWGMKLAVIDLFLLSSCQVVLGTPFSTFSEVATYIGGALQLEPDFRYSGLES